MYKGWGGKVMGSCATYTFNNWVIHHKEKKMATIESPTPRQRAAKVVVEYNEYKSNHPVFSSLSSFDYLINLVAQAIYDHSVEEALEMGSDAKAKLDAATKLINEQCVLIAELKKDNARLTTAYPQVDQEKCCAETRSVDLSYCGKLENELKTEKQKNKADCIYAALLEKRKWRGFFEKMCACIEEMKLAMASHSAGVSK